MNPIFIIAPSDIPISNFDNNNISLNYYNYDGNTDLISEFNSFRNNVLRLGTQINYTTNEILCVCISEAKNILTSKNYLIKLFSDNNFSNEINKVFLIDLLSGGSAELPQDYYVSCDERTSELCRKFNIKAYNIILSQENAEKKIIDRLELTYQLKTFIYQLHTDFETICKNLKDFRKNDIYYNSYGSSSLTFPYKYIEESIFYFNNSSQLLYLLNESEFTKEEYQYLSSIIRSKEDEEIDINEIYKDRYSKEPDNHDVAIALNTLWDRCKIDDIGVTFESIGLNSFTNYSNKNEILSISINEEKHKKFIYDQVHRVTNSFQTTTVFSNEITKVFREFRNDKLISFQRDLNRHRNDKRLSLFQEIDKFSNEIISLDQATLQDSFRNTTGFEAISKVHSCFSYGIQDDTIQHDNNLQNKQKTLSNETVYERTLKKRDLYNKLNNDNEIIKNQIDKIDKEFESKILNYTEKIKQLQLGKYEQKPGLNGYTFLSKAIFFAIFFSLVVFFISFFISSQFDLLTFSKLKISILVGIIPLLICGIIVLNKWLNVNRLRNEINKLLKIKLDSFRSILSNYDFYFDRYIEEVKIDYALNILKDTQNYCQSYVHKLDHFRQYVFDHYISSVSELSSLDFSDIIFEIPVASKDQILDKLFDFSDRIYYRDNPDKKIDLWKLYLEKSTIVTTEIFEPIDLNIDFFNESENAYEIVEPLDQHKPPVSNYSNFEGKEAKLFLADEENKKEILISDINQGEVGDCYFLAAIGAIAHANPEFMKRMISRIDTNKNNNDLQSHSFFVRFFDSNKSEKYVAVDDKFWFFTEANDQMPVYAKYGVVKDNEVEIWPMILEKAWAKVNGNYESINGSNSEHKYLDFGMALSGNLIDYEFLFDDNDHDTIISAINNKLKQNIPVVVYSKDDVNSEQVQINHAYAIITVDPDNKTMSLYNPHGNDHLNNISVEFLIANFDTLLFFNLKHEALGLAIPKDKRKIITNIKTAEDIFRDFIGNDYMERIEQMPVSEFIASSDLINILKNTDKTSLPLFNPAKINEKISMIYASEEVDYDISIFSSKINEVQECISPGKYFCLIKLINWQH